MQTGPVAWTGLAQEHDKAVLLSVRLTPVNRQITEAESIVVHAALSDSLSTDASVTGISRRISRRCGPEFG